MILIYESTETDFNSLGLGTLCPSSCIVTEELNGQYSLTLSHPIDEGGKWEKLQQDRIIKAPTHDGDQLFRLYRPVKNTQRGTIEVSALHIFYDLNDNLIEDTRPTIKDGQDAGEIILAGCQYPTPFTFSSDITGVTTAYYIRKNPVEAFIGEEDQSFINRWGGEIRRNNYNVEINQRCGSDTGMKISYRKNLVGVEMASDTSQVITRILPTALDQNGVVFYTDAKYYNSPLIGTYPHPKIGVLDTGIRVGQEVDGNIPYPTIASAKTAMAAMAQSYFTAGADKPDVSISVTYVDLGETDEYAAYKDIITKAHMGDDVTLEHPELGIDVKLRVVKIDWDAASNRISSIVLGNQLPNYANTAVSRDIDVSVLKRSAPTNLQENGLYNDVRINHEEGFVATATIDGKTISVKQNAQDGFAIYDGSTYIGGVKVISGQVALVSNILTNNVDGDCRATIGDVEIDGDLYKGIFIYNDGYSTSVPVAKLVTYSSGGMVLQTSDKGSLVFYQDGGLAYFDGGEHTRLLIHPDGRFTVWNHDGKPRLSLDANGDFKIWDENEKLRLSITDSDGLVVRDPSGVVRAWLSDSDSYIHAPGSTNHAIGADGSGPYYVKAGIKTYLP